MTYTAHEITGNDRDGNPIGELIAIQSFLNRIVLVAQPSQDLWELDLTDYTATEVRRGFGVQTGSTVWRDEYVLDVPAFRQTGRLFEHTSAWPGDGSGTLPRFQYPVPSDAEWDDDIRNNARALASDNVTMWLLTDSYLYSFAGSPNDPSNIVVTRLGRHGLRMPASTTAETGRQLVPGGAAAYSTDLSGIIVGAADGLYLLDPATLGTTALATSIPEGLVSLTFHNGELLGLTPSRLARFDRASLRSRAAQVQRLTENWQVRLRQRKNHQIEHILTPDQVVEAEFNWRMTSSAEGRVRLATDTISPDVLDEIAAPSNDVGGFDVEFFLEHGSGVDQFLGIVDAINFYRGYTADISTVNVGSIINSIWVLGSRIAGEGGAECRQIAEVGDDFLIAARGIHQGVPIDGRGADRLPDLESIGRAYIEREVRKLKTDETVDFARAQRVDRMDLFLRDPWHYFERRYSNPGTAESRPYGGASAGEYIYNMAENELRFTPANFNPERQRDLTLTGNGVRWAFVRRDIGLPFNVPYPRTNMLVILEQACLAGGIGLHYELDPTDDLLVMTVRNVRNRTIGSDRISLIDGGEAINPDSVLVGDRVERDLVVNDHVVGSGAASRVSTTTVDTPCASGETASGLSEADLESGTLVLQKRITLDGQVGRRTKLSSGDITEARLDLFRDIRNLSNTARVS